MMYCRQNQSRTLVKRPLGLSAPTPMKLTSSLDVREPFTLIVLSTEREPKRPSLMLFFSLLVKNT